jgi:hypothetical protein
MKMLAPIALALLAACTTSTSPAVPATPATPAPKPPVMESPKAPVMEAPKAPVMDAKPAVKPEALAPKKAPVPDLLVHLKLHDGGADSSGHEHAAVVQGKVAWVPGKSGNAASFDGSGGHLELPSSPELDSVQLNSYTLAAWFKPADVPPGKEADNTANYGIINKTGWHEGLRYGNDKHFVFEHWLAGAKPEEPEWKGAGTWDTEYEPGQWYHVVGVVDRKAGATKLFVNGDLVNTGDWDANAKSRDYGTTTWKIGMAAPGSEQWAWPTKGAIGDVRIYSRALTEAEVSDLYKEGAK